MDIEDLEKLVLLKEKGILTQEEFEQKKRELFGKSDNIDKINNKNGKYKIMLLVGICCLGILIFMHNQFFKYERYSNIEKDLSILQKTFENIVITAKKSEHGFFIINERPNLASEQKHSDNGAVSYGAELGAYHIEYQDVSYNLCTNLLQQKYTFLQKYKTFDSILIINPNGAYSVIESDKLPLNAKQAQNKCNICQNKCNISWSFRE